MTKPPAPPVEILMVEDSHTDVLFAREALQASRIPNRIHVVENGEDAMTFLRREGRFASAPPVDIVFLDLNLPRKDGREVLAEIKADESLKQIPVLVLTTSSADEDVFRAYGLHANCYILKPVDFEHFRGVVRAFEEFWLSVVKLPGRPS